MSLPLFDPIPLRVLGALLEKQMSTPEYYPLTLNALVNACNQSSNRDPVMALGEGEVLAALDALKEEKLAWAVNAAGARTVKYEHALRERFELSEQEAAILCELMLRGAQTPGELRSRTSRLYPFTNLPEVDTALECLMELEEPLVARLPKQPGSREVRYAHLLGELPDSRETQPIRVNTPLEARETRPIQLPQPEQVMEVQELREEVAQLRSELSALRELLESLMK